MVRRRNKDSFWLMGVGAAVLVIGVGLAVFFFQRDDGAPEPVAQIREPAVPAPAARSPQVAPPNSAERPIPLPPLDQSDMEVQGGITELVGMDAVAQFLVPERIVRNLVVTIDNLTREQMALQQRPVKPTAGEFVTAGPEDAVTLAPENFARYKPFIDVLESVDAKTLISFYRGIQPLFQEAYEELGHPNAFFNTRLLEVIEHLLATPEPPREIRLVQPSVVFKYADERLEKLSAGQKLLIRMGPENAAIVKAKLRELQAELS